MELVTDPYNPRANSYATLAEFDEYITTRDGFDSESWNVLTDEQKTLRMVFGTLVIDSLKFRGRKACKKQALQFPRIMPDSGLYSAGASFSDLQTLKDFAGLMDEELPVVPQNIKYAQIEATYQVVHSHLIDLEAFESGEESIASLSIDAISMSFRKDTASQFNLFSKADFGAASTIKLLLQSYLSGVRGALV